MFGMNFGLAGTGSGALALLSSKSKVWEGSWASAKAADVEEAGWSSKSNVDTAVGYTISTSNKFCSGGCCEVEGWSSTSSKLISYTSL